jgi:hypothetical protein
LYNRTQSRDAANLLCTHVPALWVALSAVYTTPSAWRDGLAFSGTLTPSGVAPESVQSTGHDLFLSLLHYRGLITLADATAAAASSIPGCSAAVVLVLPAMRVIAAEIKAALASPVLWNATVGMYMPSDGNNAHNTDVWGSALAVELGVAPSDRETSIVAWFGAHWSEVVQDGQIKHLAAGQYWADTLFWVCLFYLYLVIPACLLFSHPSLLGRHVMLLRILLYPAVIRSILHGCRL